jgi:hypothetical protein
MEFNINKTIFDLTDNNLLIVDVAGFGLYALNYISILLLLVN